MARKRKNGVQRTKSGGVVLCCFVKRPMYDRARGLARAREVSVSALLRVALKRELEMQQPEPVATQ
jgi:post-segregation antitoxin (ccd killing protein)